jgi:CheY-like chemotaxis protein
MEVLRHLRDEGIDVPVMVVTAHGSVPSAIHALELGAVDFLTKPVEPGILRRTVLEVLVRHAHAGTEPYRPAPTSLGGAAHRFAETLDVARRAMGRGEFSLTESLLQQALDLDPDSPAAHTPRGALQENLGRHHAAYQSYRKALTGNRHHGPARDGMRRSCERFSLDYNNKAINPGAE